MDTAVASNYPTTRPTRDYTYEGYIPKLRQLFPRSWGVQGCEYLQVSVHNLRKAIDEGWGQCDPPAHIYTILGPSGSVDCSLLVRGTPILGANDRSGEQPCYVDGDIRSLTGLWGKVNPPPDDTPTDTTTKTTPTYNLDANATPEDDEIDTSESTTNAGPVPVGLAASEKR